MSWNGMTLWYYCRCGKLFTPFGVCPKVDKPPECFRKGESVVKPDNPEIASKEGKGRNKRKKRTG